MFEGNLKVHLLKPPKGVQQDHHYIIENMHSDTGTEGVSVPMQRETGSSNAAFVPAYRRCGNGPAQEKMEQTH